MEKIKVLHTITRFDQGGSAQATFLTLLGLKKQNFEPALLTGLPLESQMKDKELKVTENNIQQLKSENIKVIQSPFLVRRINIIKDFEALIDMWRIVKKYNPLIVHTHSSKAGFLGRLAAKLAGVPILVHSPHGHVFVGYFGPIKTKIFIILERLASRITDKIVALTQREKEAHVRLRIGSEDTFVVIHSGVELNKFQEMPLVEGQYVRRKLGLPENALIIGTSGRLEPVKGPEFLMAAATSIISQFPNTFFLLAGDGSLRQDLEKKALDFGIEKNIVFLGWREDIAKIISIFDVFCLPSLNEGMGRVLVEAMALGKPIVASNAGGIPDLITHGKNGFLVPPKNSKELAKYIQILLEDKEKRVKMGLAGKKMALNFSKEIMVSKTVELYQHLMIQKNINLPL
jgi:glycosyltransferase involved in cell wall biosynthesis